MDFLAVAFTGPSNSGKTTIIVKIAEILQNEGKKVAILKHDPKDKAVFDTPNKDSFKFSQTGAEVVVASSKRTTFFLKEGFDLQRIIENLSEFDFLLVEGLKILPLPRIGIFRNEILSDYVECCDAIAVDESVKDRSNAKNLSLFDLNDPHSIINWIKKNAKKVR